jgi:two-component system response regulator AtoC
MKPIGTVLVVDDESYVRESLAAMLTRKGFAVRTATSVEEALDPAALAGLDAVVTDLKMPDRGGLELVRELARAEPHLPVVVLTAYATVGSAVDCMHAGAFDYLVKPADPEELTLILERALRQETSRRELEYLRGDRAARSGREGPIGVSAGWQRVLELVEVAAPVDTNVLLLGESGTGKEEVAKLLHAQSARAASAFVRVNCAAIPGELFESEFFGHRRGAFTGAVADREGRFRVAHTGTLLLDEINSLPLAAQPKILRVLQDGEFERVGDSRPTKVDVRLVCASNLDLEAELEAGRFRPDLFYRINVLTIPIPPLRERREDISLLARAFLDELAPRLGKPVGRISDPAMAALRAYRWPGNVRELRNVIERALLVAQSDELRPEDLPFAARSSPAGAASEDGLNLRQRLLDAERRFLVEALRRAEGVRRRAAAQLGVDERNLAYYLKKHDLMDYEP